MNTKKILLIEDDESTSLLIKRDLISLGYGKDDIFVSNTLQQALQQPPEELFIIITDLTLPDSEACHTFDSVYQQFSYIPVIVISGISEEEFAIKTIQSGAQDYIIKTDLTKRLLEKTIRYAIERKKNINDYVRLFNESPVPMYIFECSTFRFLAVNEAALHQYGYSSEEILTMTAEDIRLREDIPLFRQTNLEAPKHYFDFGRWRHIRKNGHPFFVHVYAHGTVFNGRQARLVTAVDIDKKVKNEQQVEEKNRTITNILESITDGFFALNENWEFTYINKECETLFGFSRQDMIGKNIWSVYDKQKYMKFYTEYKLAVKEKVNVRFEEFIPVVGKWVLVNAYPSERGLSVYLVDITERRKIRERLFNDEQQLRAVMNNTSDLIWSVDESRNILIANDAFWKRMQERVGIKTHFFDEALTNKDNIAIWHNYYSRAFAGEAFSITWQKNIEGNDLYDEICFTPIFNKHRKVTAVNCFSRDITKQKLHLQKIQQQNEQLKKIGWLHSHEAKNPVSNIIGLSHLLNLTEPSDADNKRIIEGMVISANELDKVIQKITEVINESDTEKKV